MATTPARSAPFSTALPVEAPVAYITPDLAIIEGHVTTTSQQVAGHFGKRHSDVIRAIRKIDAPVEFTERNFAPSEFIDSTGRKLPAYILTRDGFAILAMGFTGKEAMQWKVAYIRAFNLMEAKLRELYVAPLLEEQEFRTGIKLRSKLVLQAQSRATVRELEAETSPRARRNLWWQLRQINDTLGIPTESMRAWLGDDAIELLPGMEGGEA